ncbi:peroxiredoxin-like family protein [Xanthovirga aplysinae]|uniref:peroxiredoxin-like family protein n=1 Tax=Xanthovirga aplysinae TaxID=2529853 RepID=UPI0012BBFFCB|nr:peroxiredoxin-like family protein [Xanthovirga aplysinae]MTI32189.1 AhpC/TSA family protein [Xanthovirga aplysinae]
MKKLFSLLLFTFFGSQFLMAQGPQGLKEGNKAPLFEGINQKGQKINLQEQLKKGPVVLMFYRGAWCPYCNKQLSQLQDSLQFITERGARVIAVSPELPEKIDETIKKTDATFHIIHDKKLAIMDAYDVSFEVENQMVKKYMNWGIDIEASNGDNGANLPVPATYIIDQNGNISYVFFDPDYKKRASVQEIIENLPAKI